MASKVGPHVLPENTKHVRTTPQFTETTVPAGLLRAHKVAEKVWGQLMVQKGAVEFVFENAPETTYMVNEGESLIIPPETLHHVVLVGPTAFWVRFHLETGV